MVSAVTPSEEARSPVPELVVPVWLMRAVSVVASASSSLWVLVSELGLHGCMLNCDESTLNGLLRELELEEKNMAAPVDLLNYDPMEVYVALGMWLEEHWKKAVDQRLRLNVVMAAESTFRRVAELRRAIAALPPHAHQLLLVLLRLIAQGFRRALPVGSLRSASSSSMLHHFSPLLINMFDRNTSASVGLFGPLLFADSELWSETGSQDDLQQTHAREGVDPVDEISAMRAENAFCCLYNMQRDIFTDSSPSTPSVPQSQAASYQVSPVRPSAALHGRTTDHHLSQQQSDMQLQETIYSQPSSGSDSGAAGGAAAAAAEESPSRHGIVGGEETSVLMREMRDLREELKGTQIALQHALHQMRTEIPAKMLEYLDLVNFWANLGYLPGGGRQRSFAVGTDPQQHMRANEFEPKRHGLDVEQHVTIQGFEADVPNADIPASPFTSSSPQLLSDGAWRRAINVGHECETEGGAMATAPDGHTQKVRVFRSGRWVEEPEA
ncbi:hypothetical protein FVE85_7473 [Porphyridium purpureum]|uniref:Uncharacterized protein n=1 Tax=Porphyridium purpureum TaxID=35688 RepID=A0A5J4Z9S2_PORPP|nr:hypothetical protein FVE85_7473 [Porphyridium purpureum]|eukprot:POR9648..scf295_1